MGAYVYILANGRNGTLYVGSTTDVARRMEEHRSGAVKGFVTTTSCICWSMSKRMRPCSKPASASGGSSAGTAPGKSR